MKKIACASIAALMLVAVSCKKDYRKDIVGKWDAGKATLESEIFVTIQADGTLTTMISGIGMKPMSGTWQLNSDHVTFKFPGLELSYRILELDDKILVMKWKYARITWHRMK